VSGAYRLIGLGLIGLGLVGPPNSGPGHGEGATRLADRPFAARARSPAQKVDQA